MHMRFFCVNLFWLLKRKQESGNIYPFVLQFLIFVVEVVTFFFILQFGVWVGGVYYHSIKLSKIRYIIIMNEALYIKYTPVKKNSKFM